MSKDEAFWNFLKIFDDIHGWKTYIDWNQAISQI